MGVGAAAVDFAAPRLPSRENVKNLKDADLNLEKTLSDRADAGASEDSCQKTMDPVQQTAENQTDPNPTVWNQAVPPHCSAAFLEPLAPPPPLRR